MNIKLASVASNIVGQSGMAMLRLLASGVCDAEQLAEHALSSLRRKLPELILALDGRPDAHFRWLLTELLSKLDRLDQERAHVDARITEVSVPYAGVLGRLATIPGVDLTTALVLLAEFGTDMSQFPTPGHLASWAGLCPGNAESAGKRLSGRTRKGDRYVRRILVQSAWAAARSKNCFLAALFFRLAQRRGLKKAAVAVAHRILIIAWHILAAPGAEYHERGGDHFDRRNPERTARKLTRRLENIGYQVTAVRKKHAAERPPKPTVDPLECAQCARWGMPRCIHLLKRKPRSIPPSP